MSASRSSARRRASRGGQYLPTPPKRSAPSWWSCSPAGASGGSRERPQGHRPPEAADSDSAPHRPHVALAVLLLEALVQAALHHVPLGPLAQHMAPLVPLLQRYAYARRWVIEHPVAAACILGAGCPGAVHRSAVPALLAHKHLQRRPAHRSLPQVALRRRQDEFPITEARTGLQLVPQGRSVLSFHATSWRQL